MYALFNNSAQLKAGPIFNFSENLRHSQPKILKFINSKIRTPKIANFGKRKSKKNRQFIEKRTQIYLKKPWKKYNIVKGLQKGEFRHRILKKKKLYISSKDREENAISSENLKRKQISIKNRLKNAHFHKEQRENAHFDTGRPEKQGFCPKVE